LGGSTLSPFVTGAPYGNWRTAPGAAAHRHVAIRVTTQLNRRRRCRELLARIVAGAAHRARVFWRSCSTGPSAARARLVGGVRINGEARSDSARRRVVQVELEVQLAPSSCGVPPRRNDRGEQRVDHQQMLDRLVVNDAHRPRLARLAASAGKEGEYRRTRCWPHRPPGALASVERSCGSAAGPQSERAAHPTAI